MRHLGPDIALALGSNLELRLLLTAGPGEATICIIEDYAHPSDIATLHVH